MKNLINYLDDYIDEQLCSHKFKNKITISKDDANDWQRKINRKVMRDEEINAHGKHISYNKIFKDKSKYNRKNKHKNNFI